MFNELKDLITRHRTFFCPLTGKCLDVRKSIAFETGGKIYGPYDKTAEVEGVQIEKFFRGHCETRGAGLRVIKG